MKIHKERTHIYIYKKKKVVFRLWVFTFVWREVGGGWDMNEYGAGFE